MASNRFVAVAWVFLGDHQAENNMELIETLVKNHSTVGCMMYFKVHILISTRTWEHGQRHKICASTRIYWTFNAATEQLCKSDSQ